MERGANVLGVPMLVLCLRFDAMFMCIYASQVNG